MDSSAFVIDRTFPIDLNESSNPDLLTEVTYGEVGIAPMMEKSSTGRMSPVRGRTMKEYDQQLTELKKENFNLKLRIYFMEERMNTKFNEEDLIKTNIELKVEMENYKKGLVEKQALLDKASETIDTLTGKYSEELEKEVINIKQDCDDNVQQANQRAYDLENELSALDDKMHQLQDECNDLLKPSLERKDKHIQELTINLEDRDKEICNLDDKIKVLKQEVTELRGQAERREEQFLEERESLRTNLGRRDRDIQRLSFIVQDKTSIEGVTALERDHLKDEVADSRRGVERLQKNSDKQQHDLDKKGQMIGKLEDLLRIKEKEKQALKKAYEERTAVYTRSKTIIGDLAKDTHEKELKIKLLEKDLHILQDELGITRDQLQQANIHRQKDADKIGELEDKLEKLVRTLGKREGELENFRDLLEKAQRSLSLSEAAVECLQTQLEKERCRCKENNEAVEQDDMARLRQELANLHVQLDEREKQYQSKCAELDTVAQRLDIKVTTQSNGSDQSDMLQRIMDELRQLKGAMESERHLHIDINSTHMDHMDGSRAHSTQLDGSRARSTQLDSSRARSTHLDGSQANSTHMDGSQAISTYMSADKDSSAAHSKHPSTHMNNLQALDIDRDDNPVSGLYHKPTVMGKNGSRIPVRRGSSTSSCTDEVDSLRHQVADLSARNYDLGNTLKATEETVRCQTQKMKHYRMMLVDNNLLPMSRSNSVPNIPSMTSRDSLSPMQAALNGGGGRRLLVESAAMRCRSVSPTPGARKHQFNDEYQVDGADRLVKENSKLKQQIDGYRRVLKVFQGRSPSPQSDSDKRGQDGEPTPISSESASCLLECWLDMLDKFLTELSQSDQEGQAPLVTSTMEITRLRRGLVQARGAIQSLSETSLVAQEKLSEGRLSPDSGCSDNPTSAQNTLKESSLNSPSSEHSVTSPRSDITSPGSEVSVQLMGQYSKNKLINGSQSRLVPGCEDTTEDKNRHHSHGSTNSGSSANQSPPGFNSNFAPRNRDAGVDPRSSGLNSFQSVERLRQFSGFANSKDVSVFSHNDIDNSVFSTGSGPRVSNVYRKPVMTKLPSASMDNSALNEPKQTTYYKPSYLDRFEQTFSPSFLGGEGDETFGDITTNTGRPSLIRFEEGSILDITSQDNMRNKTSTAEMQERIRSLEDIIHSYEEQIRQHSRPDMDSLQQQLIELRNLRIQLEKSMEQNEILERQLVELYQFSECTIRDLKSQLAESNDHVREKVRLITEKEKMITETNVSLVKYRDTCARDSADLDLCKDKVRSLESELKSSKGMCEQLTGMCQQLKTAVEQYKRRSEQLENDNKKHMDAVFRSRDTGIEQHLSSRDSMHSVERLRKCSGFTNPKDVSVFSHSDLDNSVFSTGSDPLDARVLTVKTKQPSSNMDYSASNEPKQSPYHKPSYLGSSEQTFSPRFIGGIDDESYSDTTTNSNRLPSMRITIASQDNKHAKTKMAEMQQRIRSLQDENKKEMASVFRYQNKVKNLEEEIECQANSMTESMRSRIRESDIETESLRSRLHETDIEIESMRSRMHEADIETESLRSRLHEDGVETVSLKSRVLELESSGQQWRENEAKYKTLLSQTRLQVTELSADLEIMRDELRKRDAELHTVRVELESSRDTVEEQNQHLYDKSTVINKLKVEMTEKTSILHEQDSLCQDLTGKLENVTALNGKLATQLEQQRLTCADYKRQIEKQNHLTKDLKDRIDKLREELSKSIITRESLDKLMMERQKEFQETTRLKDKYLYNLKVTYKEFTRTKKELKDVQKKCEDTNVLNSTLQTELSVRERLMEAKGDMLTDDDKQSMIAELLNELKLARVQMTKILEQNETIKKRMTELIEQLLEQRSSQQSTSSMRVEAVVNKSLTDELPDISLGANQTWPLYGDLLGGLARTDNLSCSLPLRESTPGGPASINSWLSRSGIPSLQNQQREKDKLPSAGLSQSDKNDTQSHQDSLSSSFEMELNQSTKSYTEEPVSNSGNHFSIPGPIYKQGITDNCLLYNVNDSPKYLAGLTQITIDSDVRSLFAVGMIDHFEKLRKEANESNAILKGLSTRINERLKVFAVMPATESVEYSTLKELSYATDNMRICVDSQMSLIGCFWTSELPAPNERGEFVNQKLLDQNSALREELCILMDRVGKDSAGLKSKMNEEQIYKSLESTLDVVTRAKQNFQYQQTPRMYSPHRSASHSPRK